MTVYHARYANCIIFVIRGDKIFRLAGNAFIDAFAFLASFRAKLADTVLGEILEGEARGAVSPIKDITEALDPSESSS